MVDAKNNVVCEVISPDEGVAEYIVQQCNNFRFIDEGYAPIVIDTTTDREMKE